MFLTSTLRLFIESQKHQLPPEEFEKFVWDIDILLEKYLSVFLALPAGTERGRYIHAALEDEISKNSQTKISCHRGCSACCHFEVEISSDDAAVIIEHVTKNNIDFDIERAVHLARRPRQGKEWKMGVVPENRCLFLSEEGACRIYSARPSACRKLSVISNPVECQSSSGNPVPRIIPIAEIILSAALNLTEIRLGSLPKMVVDAISNIPLVKNKGTIIE